MPEPSRRLAVLAGSFDPLTNGHLDLLDRAVRLFERVVMAVLVNPGKTPLFTIDERLAMIRRVTGGRPGVEVETFDGLLAEYVRRRGASAVVRGLRTSGEFSAELPTALMNRHLNAACETVFIVPAPSVMQISSRLVREIAALGGSLDGLVPPAVADELRRRFPAPGGAGR